MAGDVRLKAASEDLINDAVTVMHTFTRDTTVIYTVHNTRTYNTDVQVTMAPYNNQDDELTGTDPPCIVKLCKYPLN